MTGRVFRYKIDPPTNENDEGETMDTEAIESQARRLAAAAVPGMLKHEGHVYTLVFNQREWVYEVFKDGFFYLKLLKEYLTSLRVRNIDGTVELLNGVFKTRRARN